jgi:hypothetical protein
MSGGETRSTMSRRDLFIKEIWIGTDGDQLVHTVDFVH